VSIPIALSVHTLRVEVAARQFALICAGRMAPRNGKAPYTA
jgi:hypothetical protein